MAPPANNDLTDEMYGQAFMFYQDGLSTSDSLERLVRQYGDLAPTLTTLYAWRREFRSGKAMSVSPQPPHSDSNNKDEYSEFDLLAEHHINVQKISLANGEKLNGPLHHESTASIGHSQWRICFDFITHEKKARLDCVELQLVGFSRPIDPTQYAIELVVFTTAQDDGYSEHIYEKKRMTVDGETIKTGTKFYGRDPQWLDMYDHDQQQIFKIDSSVLPLGLIIRILRKQLEEHPKIPRIETDKTLVVNDRRFPVSSQYLSAFSPVFAAMFQTEMAEKEKDEIEIKDVHSSNHFADFLRAISPSDGHILPNPSNVLELCELADRFQVDSVRSKCEQFLQNCVEIPLAQRFFFADKHSMNGLIEHFLTLIDGDRLMSFYLDNKTALDNRPALVSALLTRVSEKNQASRKRKLLPSSSSSLAHSPTTPVYVPPNYGPHNYMRMPPNPMNYMPPNYMRSNYVPHNYDYDHRSNYVPHDYNYDHTNWQTSPYAP